MNPDVTTRNHGARLLPLRFTLRTLFVIVTVACVYLWWATNWINQRRAFADSQAGKWVLRDAVHGENPRAPWGLWLLGEKGVGEIWPNNKETVATASKLFPEALVRRDIP